MPISLFPDHANLCSVAFCLLIMTTGLSTDAIGARKIPPVLPDSFDVPIDGKVQISIDGRPTDALMTPGMPNSIYIAKYLALSLFGKEAGQFGFGARLLRAFGEDSPFYDTKSRVGPVTIPGLYREVQIDIGQAQALINAAWYNIDAYPFAEALAGPYALPIPVIRFALRAPQPKEVSFTLPLAPINSWWIATTPKDYGDVKLLFAFAPQFKTTVASAAAGAVIAASHGGSFTGEAVPVSISYDVKRPARPVKLTQPLEFGPLKISTLLVRTRDYGSASSIKDPSVDDPSESAGDIVVKGKRKPSRPLYVVYIGADTLAACSSIIYDKPAATITLSCVQPAKE